MSKTGKISVIGHLARGTDMNDGQTVKTRTVVSQLEEAFGPERVMTFDTRGAIGFLLKAPFILIYALARTQNVLILPAQRGLRVIVPLLRVLNCFFHRRLHYCAIGGWLPQMIRNIPSLEKKLRIFHGIYVETKTMKTALESMGFDNIFLVPNCKLIEPLKEDELTGTDQEPYRLCTFSRVMREKGIEDAIAAVSAANEAAGRTAFLLDIYGPVDPAQTEWFDALKASFPETVRYRGVIPTQRSTEALKGCFALLFPTRFFTEGVPGTIIDAYAAGVPVIAARWESFGDIVDDGVTGIGYPFGDADALAGVLNAVRDHPERIVGMKAACIRRARTYLPQNAMKPLIEQLGA